MNAVEFIIVGFWTFMLFVVKIRYQKYSNKNKNTAQILFQLL